VIDYTVLMPNHTGKMNQGQQDSTLSSHEPSAEATTSHTTSDHGSRKKWFSRLRGDIYVNCIQPLVTSRHTPSYDAKSVSIGLIIGFIIPVGGQLLFLGFLRAFISFNYIVAAGFTLVSNPFNMIPLYYGYYCLGSYVLGRPIALNFHCFEKLMNPVLDKTFFWEALSAFAELGEELLIPWLVAAVILSVVFGTAGYVVTFRIQKKRCKKAAQRLGVQYEEYLARLKARAPQA